MPTATVSDDTIATETTTRTPRKVKAKAASLKTTIAAVPEPPTFALQDRGRTIRSVTFALGPVTFLGGVHGAVADQTDPLVNLCVKDNHPPARIRRPDKCSLCGNDDKTTFVKGQVNGDEITVLNAEDFQAIKDADEAFSKSVQLRMVQADDRLLIPAGAVYYVSAKGAAATAYSLIATIVRARPNVAFLGELSFGGAPHLFRVQVTDSGVLALREVARPEAVREQPQVAEVPVDATTMGFLKQLVDASTQPFEPTAFANPHAKAVDELLQSATPTVAAAPTATGGGVTASEDILSKLRASVAALETPTPAKPVRRRRAKPATAA